MLSSVCLPNGATSIRGLSALCGNIQPQHWISCGTTAVALVLVIPCLYMMQDGVVQHRAPRIPECQEVWAVPGPLWGLLHQGPPLHYGNHLLCYQVLVQGGVCLAPSGMLLPRGSLALQCCLPYTNLKFSTSPLVDLNCVVGVHHAVNLFMTGLVSTLHDVQKH